VLGVPLTALRLARLTLNLQHHKQKLLSNPVQLQVACVNNTQSVTALQELISGRVVVLVCPAVLAVCATIKLVDGKIAWQLDRSNYALTLYRTSQFMLSLLLAFRLVGTCQLWSVRSSSSSSSSSSWFALEDFASQQQWADTVPA
jgi:hypothetical protein